MIDLSAWDVYLVTDTILSKKRSNLEVVKAAVNGGVSAVQLREKLLSSRDFFFQGLEIRELLAEHNVPLIINDRIDLAIALDADGVHLGQSDLPLEIARRILGPDKIIGWSVNDLSQINQRSASLVDYFAISPVFFTSTKKDISTPWGTEGVAKARSITTVPLVGIGGIGLDNVSGAIRAGLDCVAVVSAIVSADDPFVATESLKRQVVKAKQIRTNGLNETMKL
ncbi:MAG: thiamine phosphate synthase [Deltaproteobacteria bacterium]|nr:thiamine phosphate synthase [Deltaproteobacteria bacterium]